MGEVLERLNHTLSANIYAWKENLGDVNVLTSPESL